MPLPNKVAPLLEDVDSFVDEEACDLYAGSLWVGLEANEAGEIALGICEGMGCCIPIRVDERGWRGELKMRGRAVEVSLRET